MRYQDWLRERLENDPEFRQEWEALEPEYEIRNALVEARIAGEMSQDDLAEAMGITQAAVARMESGRSAPTVTTLHRIAAATGVEFVVNAKHFLQARKGT